MIGVIFCVHGIAVEFRGVPGASQWLLDLNVKYFFCGMGFKIAMYDRLESKYFDTSSLSHVSSEV